MSFSIELFNSFVPFFFVYSSSSSFFLCLCRSFFLPFLSLLIYCERYVVCFFPAYLMCFLFFCFLGLCISVFLSFVSFFFYGLNPPFRAGQGTARALPVRSQGRHQRLHRPFIQEADSVECRFNTTSPQNKAHVLPLPDCKSLSSSWLRNYGPTKQSARGSIVDQVAPLPTAQCTHKTTKRTTVPGHDYFLDCQVLLTQYN